MIGEPIYQRELAGRAKQILKNYSLGRLIVALSLIHIYCGQK